MTDHPVPDENTLVLPEAWYPHLAPRRGGQPIPVVPVPNATEKAARLVVSG
ncbi:hypothetical protein [Actinoalloteichus hymeniacidonis]|uniref:Uncharacterized protein n=1 Tax=Actinoalloteichus hymeniacidonis TaxID=340345 RepID=A0AAC9HRY5_9PSEU|nr:hypothetical protein [Actinoalloteichus hymeniacidonis]AOS63876.1 hypothetical protein TL08_15335 [Actinoalloteichus hymeniacidonis]MBB5908068.1 Ni,Fe-hydrogenase III component G [Actinoalloteichus hymeniacidonis]